MSTAKYNLGTGDHDYQQWVANVQRWLETRPADPFSGGPIDDLENLHDLIGELLAATGAAYASTNGVLPQGACAK